MQGYDIKDPELKGIIPRMVEHIFTAVASSPAHIEFTVKVSIVEIYMEKIRDLLDATKVNLKVREDKRKGIYIEDVTEVFISQMSEVYVLIDQASSNRCVAYTNMNEGSSRSHLLFMMSIHQQNLTSLGAKNGKLFLVDLAGSEKISKTGAEGQTLKEAQQINKSLSCLGNVINALTEGKAQHVPYRNSTLTRVMTESLGGNATTTLITTCSPSIFNEMETLSTLRFGLRAKAIKNKPKVNRELTVGELQKMLEKAETEIKNRDIKIQQLEDLIKKNAIEIPKLGDTVSPLTITSTMPDDSFKDNYNEIKETKEPLEEEFLSMEIQLLDAQLLNEAQEERVLVFGNFNKSMILENR